MIFHSQEELSDAFRAGELDRDFVAVVRFQGPKANGMPELHKLTPTLGVLQDRGHKVALLTDGRMSGASGKVPAAIHVTPEAADGGAIAKLRDGDIIRLDAPRGRLQVLVDAGDFARAHTGDHRPRRQRIRRRPRALPPVPCQCPPGGARGRGVVGDCHRVARLADSLRLAAGAYHDDSACWHWGWWHSPRWRGSQAACR